MKLTKEEMDKISARLSNLCTYCDFMREEATIRQYVISCYCDDDLDKVISNLQDVMHYYEPLMDRLHLLSVTLDGLLVQSRVLDEAEMI